MGDEAFEWLQAHDPIARGVSAEEYRRRTGIQSLAAEHAETCRHAAESLADFDGHCPACHHRADAERHTVE